MALIMLRDALPSTLVHIMTTVFLLVAMSLVASNHPPTFVLASSPVSSSHSSLSSRVRKNHHSSHQSLSQSSLSQRWHNALSLSVLEQSVEDHNAQNVVAVSSSVAESSRSRRLIALPLDERFDPPAGSFSRDHIQSGDKISLPRVFWDAIQLNQAEVPWLFSVTRAYPSLTPRAPYGGDPESNGNGPDPMLKSVVGGVLDFRSPSNYVFLPRWMMRALAIRPWDVVDIRLATDIPAGSGVKLRPHLETFSRISDHRSVLETELRHYSSLTEGSTIPFDYRGERYYFDVVALRAAPRGESRPIVKVQDCDVAAEFTRARDTVKRMKEERQKRLDEKSRDD